MKKKFISVGMVFTFFTFGAMAQNNDSLQVRQLDEVVVSDSKFALGKEKSGKIISKITAQDLANNPGQSIATLLNTIAGVEINGNQNGAGKNLGYFIRGGKSNQVMILIDGVPMVDASGISFEYDLRFLNASQVESIEVLKGASSVLYGSGAATGVINIKLKQTKIKEFVGNAFVNSGSNNTVNANNSNSIDFNAGLSINGKSGITKYLFGANVSETNGISQIADMANTNFESDRFSRKNIIAKIDFEITPKLNLGLFSNFDKIFNDYDLSFDSTNANDTNLNKSNLSQFRFGILPTYKYANGELVLNSSFSKTERRYDDYDSYSNSMLNFDYKSRSVNADIFNKYSFNDQVFFVLGTQYQFHDMSTVSAYDEIKHENTKFNMVDPYITAVFNSRFGLNLNLGSRLNHHSQYGNQLVYNINPSFDFKTLPIKILSSISTAFVTPSLYQLYSQYGNLSLTPERNRTIEAGFETNLLTKKLTLNAIGFYREQTNFIGFFYNAATFASNYINIDGENKAKGVETEIRFLATENIVFNANYTFTQVDEALNRLIPKHKINASIDYSISKKLFLNLNYQYTDQRNDAFYDAAVFKTQKVVLNAYKLLNTTIRYDFLPNRLSVFGNLSNALNENFVENIGYSARGRNYKLGLDFKF